MPMKMGTTLMADHKGSRILYKKTTFYRIPRNLVIEGRAIKVIFVDVLLISGADPDDYVNQVVGDWDKHDGSAKYAEFVE